MLISEDYAVIPIGITCQTAHQIKRNSDRISELLGQKMHWTSSLFSWIVSSPLSSSYIFRNGENYRFNYNEFDYDMSVFSREMKIWPIHDEVSSGNRHEINRVVDKYNYLLKKYYKINNKKIRYFVISNSDRNLTDFHMWQMGKMDASIDHNHISDIQKTLDFRFPNGKNIILLALSDYEKNIFKFGCYARYVKTSNEWQGDDNSWESFFDNMPQRSYRPYINKVKNAISCIGRRSCNTSHMKFHPRDGSIKINEATTKLIDNKFIVSGSHSIAFYGPYIRLPVGRYEVSLVVDGPINGIADFEVTKNRGENVIFTIPIDSESISDKNKVKMRFAIGNDASYFEVRLILKEEFYCEVKYIEIKKIP